MTKENVLDFIKKIDIKKGDGNTLPCFYIKDDDTITDLSKEMISLMVNDQEGNSTRLAIFVKSPTEIIVDAESLNFQRPYTFKYTEFIND